MVEVEPSDESLGSVADLWSSEFVVRGLLMLDASCSVLSKARGRYRLSTRDLPSGSGSADSVAIATMLDNVLHVVPYLYENSYPEPVAKLLNEAEWLATGSGCTPGDVGVAGQGLYIYLTYVIGAWENFAWGRATASAPFRIGSELDGGLNCIFTHTAAIDGSTAAAAKRHGGELAQRLISLRTSQTVGGEPRPALGANMTNLFTHAKYFGPSNLFRDVRIGAITQ